MRKWKKNAKREEVSFQRLPVSAENNGKSALTWNPGLTNFGEGIVCWKKMKTSP
jgi:hypothetical protein